MSVHTMVPSGSHTCGEEMLAYCAVSSGSHVCGEEISAHRTVCREEMLAYHAVPSGSHVCGKEISAYYAVLNGSYIHGDEIFADVTVPHRSHVVIQYQYLIEQQSPMRVKSVVRRCLHIIWSPVGAASVVKNNLQPAHATVPNGSYFCGAEIYAE
ncbi:hypothetical protein BD769DRAFT_1387362 [Suillus cothurnatus]|nr:hypothetical protein BD769DRAFT_1387362 [Suillus cothurnatus]